MTTRTDPSISELEARLIAAVSNVEHAARTLRGARATFERLPSWKIETGRAYSRLLVAESNLDGAVEALKVARCNFDEALNER